MVYFDFFVLILRILSELSKCAAVSTWVCMHAYTTVVEDYPVMFCRLNFALLIQNRFGHPEIKTGYTYKFLAIQLNLPADVRDRSIYSLDAKNLIVGQILLYIQSKKRFWFESSFIQ